MYMMGQKVVRKHIYTCIIGHIHVCDGPVSSTYTYIYIYVYIYMYIYTHMYHRS